MRYLVVSDSHGDKEILLKLIENFFDQVDAMFHCGDSELSADDEVFAYFSTVTGNCDYEPAFKEERTFSFGTDKILLAHGHLLGVSFGLDSFLKEMDRVKANLGFFGHTHQLGVEKIAGKIVLNPGSISYPRGKYQVLGGTFAIVETSPTQTVIQYYDRQLQPLKDLKVVFKNA